MPLGDMEMPRDEQAWRDYVAARLREGDERMAGFATSIKSLEGKVDSIDKNTSDIVNIFDSLKGGFRVLGWLGSLLKWLAYVGTPLGTALAIAKGWIGGHDLPKGK